MKKGISTQLGRIDTPSVTGIDTALDINILAGNSVNGNAGNINLKGGEATGTGFSGLVKVGMDTTAGLCEIEFGETTSVLRGTVPNFAGLQYGNDYSANYSTRSLVDKAYVDNALPTAGNGLTNNSGAFDIEGSLTKNSITSIGNGVTVYKKEYTHTNFFATVGNFNLQANSLEGIQLNYNSNPIGYTFRPTFHIDTSQAFGFRFRSFLSGVQDGSIIIGDPNYFFRFFSGSGLNATVYAGKFSANLVLAYGNTGFTITSAGATFTSNTTEHISYNSDKRAGFTARSIPDKEYVDNTDVTIELIIEANGTALTTGDGLNGNFFRVPARINGYDLIAVAALTPTVGTSGTTTVQIHNVSNAVDMLSTTLTIDANENDSSTATTAAVINTANDDVAEGDILRVDVDAVSSGAEGLAVTLTFKRP